MIAGVLLAAGAGRRMGGPKALVRDSDGVPWVRSASQRLLEGGCAPVVAVLGAAAEEAAGELPAAVRAVLATDWQQGMGASLRAGLAALAELEPAPTAALVALVDTPGVTAAVVHRLLEAAGEGEAEAVLLRADYGAGPGHPVVIGRAHWAEAARVAHGDQGARELLSGPGVRLIGCADLGDGADIDHPWS